MYVDDVFLYACGPKCLCQHQPKRNRRYEQPGQRVPHRSSDDLRCKSSMGFKKSDIVWPTLETFVLLA